MPQIQDNPWAVVSREPSPADQPPAKSSGQIPVVPAPPFPVRTGGTGATSASSGDSSGGWGVVSRIPPDEQMLPETMPMTDPHGRLEIVPREQIRQKVASGWKTGPPGQGDITIGPNGQAQPVPGFWSTLKSNVSGLAHTVFDAPGTHTADMNFGWAPNESAGLPFRDPEFTAAMADRARASGKPFVWKGVTYNQPAHLVPLNPTETAIESMPSIPVGGMSIPNVLAPIARMMRGSLSGSTQSASQVAPLVSQGRYSEAAGHALATATPGGSVAEAAGQQAGERNYAGALGNAATLAAPMVAGKLLPKVAGKAGSALLSPLEKRVPRVVNIEGVNVPVLVGEAEAPGAQSTIGNHTVAWKAEGMGAKHFNRIAASQQAAVGEVINRVAQHATGDLTPDEAATAAPRNFPSYSPAGQSMRSATVVSALRSFPMYQAIDASMAHTPELLTKINGIVDNAVARAKAMGIHTMPDEMSSAVNSAMAEQEAAYQQALQQYRISPNSSGALQLRHSMGLPVDAPEGAGPNWSQQPAQNYMVAKSHLYNFADPEAAPGSAVPSPKALNVIRGMDAQIEQAIRNSGNTELLKNWQQAGRTWAKVSALRQVTDALQRASTEGTPVSQQAAGLAPRVPEISGASLVDALNALDFRGQLREAFPPDQVTALRNVADILDRAQQTRVGMEPGIKLRGYSTHSVAMHGAIDMIRRIGAAPFIRIMTSDINAPGPTIAQFVNRMAGARTPAAATAALSGLRDRIDKYPTQDFGGPNNPGPGGTPPHASPPSGNPPPPVPSLASYSLSVNTEPMINGTDLELRTPQGRAVGTMFLRQHAPVNGMQASEIGSVNLAPSHQGSGIGQAFIIEGARHAIDQGDSFLVVNQPTPELSRSIRVLQARYPGELTVQHSPGGTQWIWNLEQMSDRLAGRSPSAPTAAPPTAGHPVTAPPTAPYSSVGRPPESPERTIQTPQPPPGMRTTAQPSSPGVMTRAQRAAIVAGVMTQLKNGEISQQEADRKIQKANGGGGRKIIRMPQDPRMSAQ